MLIRVGHEGWDKGEGVRRWGGGLGQAGGARAWLKGGGARAWLGGALVKTKCIFFISPQKLI